MCHCKKPQKVIGSLAGINHFCLYQFFSKESITGSPYTFLEDVFVCSENVVNTQNNYTAVVWIPRCKDAKILNETLAMILCGSTIRSYVNKVFDCIKSNDLTMNYLFRCLKI